MVHSPRAPHVRQKEEFGPNSLGVQLRHIAASHLAHGFLAFSFLLEAVGVKVPVHVGRARGIQCHVLDLGDDGFGYKRKAAWKVWQAFQVTTHAPRPPKQLIGGDCVRTQAVGVFVVVFL